MRFGEQIRMLRDYDGNRFAEGETYTVAMGEPEEGKVAPGVADALCQEAADGEGPFAEQIDDSSTTDEE